VSYETLLAEYSRRRAGGDSTRLRQHRPYLELIPSLCRP
jgi:hypothetical protein